MTAPGQSGSVSPKAFLPQETWDQIHERARFSVAEADDPMTLWIRRQFQGGSGSCLELGCFPGRFLALFGQMGYELNGLDLTPRVEQDLGPWLKSQGFRVGSISRGDAFTHDFGRRFDVVCSFGLIEHFPNWDVLVQRHAHWVAPGGLLAVSAPNFRGRCQHSYHKHFDAENLAGHNLEAMDPAAWRRVVEALGFSIVQCGYIGPFDIWHDPRMKRSFFQKLVVHGVWQARRLFRWLPAWPSLAPYCGLVARKPRNQG